MSLPSPYDAFQKWLANCAGTMNNNWVSDIGLTILDFRSLVSLLWRKLQCTIRVELPQVIQLLYRIFETPFTLEYHYLFQPSKIQFVNLCFVLMFLFCVYFSECNKLCLPLISPYVFKNHSQYNLQHKSYIRYYREWWVVFTRKP